jgi:phosphoglucomutase
MPRPRLTKSEHCRISHPDSVRESQLAGEPIVCQINEGPGQPCSHRRTKSVARSGWFAAPPSGTGSIYKIYAESFKDESHLNVIINEAREIVSTAVGKS